MTQQVNINKYLDSKNTALYTNLSKNFKIELSKILTLRPDGNNSLWLCRINQNEVNISYYEDVSTTGYFTHELFHVSLLDKGFSNFIDLYQDYTETTEKELIFQPIIGHINNIFAHAKFYNDFISLNYEPHEFVNDYEKAVNKEQTISTISESFNSIGLPNNSISMYIATFYTAKDNKNPKLKSDYDELLSYLYTTDKDLFTILNQHWEQWVNSNTFNNREILVSLFNETENWYKKR